MGRLLFGAFAPAAVALSALASGVSAATFTHATDDGMGSNGPEVLLASVGMRPSGAEAAAGFANVVSVASFSDDENGGLSLVVDPFGLPSFAERGQISVWAFDDGFDGTSFESAEAYGLFVGSWFLPSAGVDERSGFVFSDLPSLGTQVVHGLVIDADPGTHNGVGYRLIPAASSVGIVLAGLGGMLARKNG